VRATFIDFEDSFSFNIIQELSELGIEVEYILWSDWDKIPDSDLLVLGPGPGHPDDYQRIFPLVGEWLNTGKNFFGICLGHQIFWRLHGAEVIRSANPLHGQRVLLDLDTTWRAWFKLGDSPLYVQRYNSLAVPSNYSSIRNDLSCFSQDGDLMISKGNGILTYQFHPESQGTNYRFELFRPVLSDIV
jgi:anthranilate/para-aminobenzoate synthase component II